MFFLCLAAFAQDTEVRLPNSPGDLARGKKLFMGSCTYCHGPTGDGGKGADLSRQDLVRAKSDGDLARIIEVGLPGTEMPGAWQFTRREVTQVAAFVRSLAKVDVRAAPGDPAAGKALYSKHGCAGCHTLQQDGMFVGGYMGPDLSSIGLRRTAAYLREALVDPAASLPEGFMIAKAVTKDGKTITGKRVNEDTFTIIIRDAGGANHAFFKKDLKSFALDPKASPMPSYKSKLSGGELENLIAYLVSLKEQI